jgi:hypothetical protein
LLYPFDQAGLARIKGIIAFRVNLLEPIVRHRRHEQNGADWANNGLEAAARKDIEEGIALWSHSKKLAMDRWTQTPNLVFQANLDSLRRRPCDRQWRTDRMGLLAQ